MAISWILIIYVLFWIAVAIGSVGMLIWAIASRIKEKKIEEVKHKDYKKH